MAHLSGDASLLSAFARGLDSNVYCPVIIRDTEEASKSPPRALEGLLTCPEASLDAGVRAALYERAALNMVSANGRAMAIAPT